MLRSQRPLGRRALLTAGLSLLGGSFALADDDLRTALRAALSEPQLPARRPERVALMSIAKAGQRLVAVGEHGVIGVSDDRGQQWRNARSGSDVTLTQVRFADDHTGWAIGHLGVVLRTDDGGLTWQRQLDGERLEALSREAGAQEPAMADRPWLDLLVIDRDRLLLIGAFNQALRSDDGGRHWQSVAVQWPNPQGLHLYGVTQLDDDTLVLVGEQGLILRGRLDGGFERIAPVYEGSLFGVVALGGQRLVAYGLRGHVFHSGDAGRTWQRAQVQGATASFNSAAVLGRDRMVLCDQAGRVYLSDDAGQQFRSIPSGGAPITGVVALADDQLMLATLGGAMPLGLASTGAPAPTVPSRPS